MPKLREDLIHMAIRQHLRRLWWRLVAGQYPDGSDDELPPLNIMDPILARDRSPDHRRHSKNKLVPDLVAHKDHRILIIEMKPNYQRGDEIKLLELINKRRHDLLSALHELVTTRNICLPEPLEELTFIPCLGFSDGTHFKENTELCYFLVSDINTVRIDGKGTRGLER
jgi:hypothetical protein